MSDVVPRLAELVAALDAAIAALFEAEKAADTAWTVWELAQDHHIRAQIAYDEAHYRYEAHRRQAIM